MAMATWVLGNRNIHSGRFNRKRQESEEDVVKLDLEKDPHENASQILLELSKTNELTNGKRLNYLNYFVKLTLHVGGNLDTLGYTIEEILYCLRISLVHEATQIRSGAFRAIRHILANEDDIIYFNKLLIPYMVARSLDLNLKNDVERIEAMKLIRKVLLLSPKHFDITLARCLVSLANGGIEEKDRMLRVCLAALSELGILNSELFISAGGVAAVTRNLLECQTPKIAESLCGVLLLLLDRPITRNHAAVDLHCVAAPYCDFHYRHGWMDKNRDERELRFNCSRLALLSILRSWPGIIHFCSPNDTSGLKAIVEVLYLNQLEVRKAVLDLLYELLNLPQPEWTDELSVALSAIDPAEPQNSWRINEGFVAAEGRSVLPHLARTTPSIGDMHLSLLLYCFLDTGLLGALAEVIATSDTFISVRATVLLGELLRLIQVMLPPECCNITPALPNLLEYATTNRPQALRAVTALQQLHKLLKRRPASYSLYLDFILRSGTFIKSSNKAETFKKYRTTQTKSKLSQFVLKDGDEEIKETGVLFNKDAFTWNWNLIKVLVKGETECTLDLAETNHRSFLKRLTEYYTPSNNRYSHMDLSSPKNTQGYTIVGIELIQCLVRLNDEYSLKLLMELFADISKHIVALTSGKSAHDCLFSPQHMTNTQCQSYFLFIGRLASTKIGVELMTKLNLFEVLQTLATTTNHDCYVKLIISSLEYSDRGPARDLLSAILTCPNESTRLYATQFLLVLLRAGIPRFSTWGLKLLSTQLKDKSRVVYLSAIATLHEACEIPDYLEELVIINPELLHLGEKGVLLLIRFLSVQTGFNLLKKREFIINEVRRWDEYFNFRYVFLVEGETSDALSLHQRGEDGRYDKRTSSLRSTSRRDLYLPPHIYGQLSRLSDGFQLLLEHGSLETLIQCLENGLCETEQDILKLKASIWALGHVGNSIKGADFLNNKSVLALMVSLVEHCVVYSVRATAFYALGLVATTRNGADCLFKLGWVCTRHDRHDKWPIIEEENWEEEKSEEPTISAPFGSDSDRTSSDQAFYLPDADSSTTTDEDILFVGESGYNLSATQAKSFTLPYQNLSLGHHKRSSSESKTFELLRAPYDRFRDRVDSRLSTDMPHRYRDNSVTESTTSGVSSSSLTTLKTPGFKLRRHSESSKRVSLQSITPSDRSTISPASSTAGRLSHQDLMGYAKYREIRKQMKQSVEELSETVFEKSKREPTSLEKQRIKYPLNYTDYETGVFGNYLFGGLSQISLASVKTYSVNPLRKRGQCYMGISLPITLANLFPENQVTARRLSYTADKSMSEGFDAGSDSEMSIIVEGSKEKRTKYFKHESKTCLSCSYIRDKTKFRKGIVGEGSNETVIENDIARKYEILKQVERLSNPVLMKQAKQTLLQNKQKNQPLFQDICLYSEVCKMVSENSYRLGPRRFIQEIFLDVNFEVFAKDIDIILSKEHSRSGSDPSKTIDVERIKILKYTDIAKQQRKAELTANKSTVIFSNKNVVIGFKVEISTGDDLSPTRFEPRSPPLSSVKEENTTSTENLLNDNFGIQKQNSITNKTDKQTVTNTIKTLDQLKLTYNENKFPIKTRDDNIKT